MFTIDSCVKSDIITTCMELFAFKKEVLGYVQSTLMKETVANVNMYFADLKSHNFTMNTRIESNTNLLLSVWN